MAVTVLDRPPAAARRSLGAALTLACLLVALVVGGRSGRLDPLLLIGVAAVPGLLLLPLVVARPRLVLVGLVVVTTANLGAVASGLGVPGLTKAALVVGICAAVRGVRGGQLRLHATVVYVALAVFLLSQAASLLLAASPGSGLVPLADLAQAAVLLVVLVTMASGPGGLATLACTALCSMAALAGLSVVQEFVLGNATEFGGLSRVPKGADPGGSTGRHAGPYYDANFWGRDLVLFLPLAFAISSSAVRRGARAAAGGAAVLLLLGIYLTQSRGAYLAVGVAVVCYLALAGPRLRRLLWATPLALLLLLALPGVGSRLTTVTQVFQAATGGGDPSLVGRVAALRLGAAMALDNPLLGVGKGNFLLAQPEYQRRDPTFTERDIAPHNLYVELAAESGVLGLLAWCTFFASVVALALHARHRGRRLPTGSVALAPGLAAGLAAWAFASIFLHLAEFHLLLLVVALAVLVHVQAERLPPPPRRPVHPELRLRRWAVAAGVVGFAGALVAAVGPLDVTRPAWQAVVSSSVSVRTSDARPYEYDVASRSVLSSTYAAVVEGEADRLIRTSPDGAVLSLRVAVQPSSQLVTVTSVAYDRQRAVNTAQAALGSGSRLIERTGSFYVLRTLEREQVRRQRLPDAAELAKAAGLAVGGAALAGSLVLLAGRYRRRSSVGRA